MSGVASKGFREWFNIYTLLFTRSMHLPFILIKEINCYAHTYTYTHTHTYM